MRLGFLGPSDGDAATVGRAADHLLNANQASKVVYLADDGALDRAVATWAKKLVGTDPTSAGMWKRAAEIAPKATPAELDEFVQSAKNRLKLRALFTLPDKRTRTIEMVGDRVAVLVHDKALLDEEDIMGASFLIFGKSDTPLLKKIGARWFLSPGKLGTTGGSLLLDDTGEDVIATVFDAQGKELQKEPLALARLSKMRIQGGV